MTLLETILTKMGIAPKPMFDTSLGLGRAKAIMVANKLGIFEKLSGRQLSAQELAVALDSIE